MLTASSVSTDTNLYIQHLGLMLTASSVCTDTNLYIQHLGLMLTASSVCTDTNLYIQHLELMLTASSVCTDKGGMGVTSAWSPLGNFIEGQAHPNVLLILCFSRVITYGSRVFCITFQSI